MEQRVMLMTKQYEQTGVFDPTDPTQRRRITHAYPGGGEYGSGSGYSSFYFNRVPDTSQLHGLRGSQLGQLGLADFSTWPAWAQIGLVGGLSALAGYFVMEKYGDKIRPVARKIPIVGGALGGHRRRGRR